MSAPLPSSGATNTAASTASSNPNKYFSAASALETSKARLEEDNFRDAVITGFGLEQDDSFVYHAIASVTLEQVQSAVDAGTAHGLCDWYLDGDGKVVCILRLTTHSSVQAQISTNIPQ